MKAFCSKSLDLYRFQIYEHAIVNHGILGRRYGKSSHPFTSMNVKFGGDDDHAVKANRMCAADSLGANIADFVFAEQTHSDVCVVVGESDRGKGSLDNETVVPIADSLITATPGLCLAILTADCAPVFLFDPVEGVIGLIHSGRAGVLNAICPKTLKVMLEHFGANPENVLVGMGPCISSRFYNVHQIGEREIRDKLSEEIVVGQKKNGIYYLDLESTIVNQLIHAGIRSYNIERSGICTYEQNNIFFSERREGRQSGRFLSMLSLR